MFFLRWHGARPSEAAALTWDNVDLRQGVAYVVASYHFREVCEPKTHAARRSIELHPAMVDILRHLLHSMHRAGDRTSKIGGRAQFAKYPQGRKHDCYEISRLNVPLLTHL